MSRFSLELVERDGYRERTAIIADDYEDLMEKIAAKTGISVESEKVETPLTDGGDE